MGNGNSSEFWSERNVMMVGEWPVLYHWLKNKAEVKKPECSICHEEATRFMDNDKNVYVCDKLHGIPQAATTSIESSDGPTCDYRTCHAKAIVRYSVALSSNNLPSASLFQTRT